jgi:hypothetical protein
MLMFGAVLVANAVMSFAYTNDDIVSPAGMVYAVAAYCVAAGSLESARTSLRTLLVVVPLTLISCAWCLRAIDRPYDLLISAERNQTDWAQVDSWRKNNPIVATVPEYAPMIERLRAEALGMHVPNPELSDAWRRWARSYSGADE